MQEEHGTSSDTLSVLALNKRCWLHPERGGSEVNLEETLSRLTDRGHTIHLLAGQFEDGDSKETDRGVHINRVGPRTSFGQPWDDLLAYFFVTLYFPIFSFKYKSDVIYSVNTPLPWFIFTSKPTVAIFHHIALESFFETHPFPLDWIGYLVQKLGIQLLGDTVAIGVSPSTVETLVRNGHPAPLTVEIRNGINIEDYEASVPTETNKILFVGGLETYKGADRLPEIHSAISEQMSNDVQLEIIGREGGASKVVKKYCQRRSSAHYHGFVSEEKKQELLSDAGILIVPSRIEGWGLAVIEANASGTPAVANAVGGLCASVQNGRSGYLIQDYNVDEFAKAVANLLEDNEHREAIANQAIEWAHQHSWRKSTSKLEDILVQVSK